MKKLHEQVSAQIKNVNEQYKSKATQEPHSSSVQTRRSYMAMLKEGKVSKIKLMDRGDEPYKIVQTVGDNVNKESF